MGRGGASGESSEAGVHPGEAAQSRESNAAASSASAGSVANMHDPPESSHSGSHHSNAAVSQHWVNDDQEDDGLSEDGDSDAESDAARDGAVPGYAI